METMYEKVQAILARQLRVDPAIVTLDAQIKKDLGADSLDILQLGPIRDRHPGQGARDVQYRRRRRHLPRAGRDADLVLEGIFGLDAGELVQDHPDGEAFLVVIEDDPGITCGQLLAGHH